MAALYYLLFCSVIIALWLIAGKYEWRLPLTVRHTLSNLTATNKEAVPAFLTLNIEAVEFDHGDVEKEIYIVRKSRRSNSQDIPMDVGINISEESLTEGEKDRIKMRLEKRFPGLTVSFAQREEEEEDALLCIDR